MQQKAPRSAFFLFTLLYLFSSTLAPVFANITYTYDANGNLTSDGTTCYTYNDANQLSVAKNCGTGKTIAAYTYDYQGNRIVQKGYDASGTLQQTTYTPMRSYETKKIVAGNVTQNTTYYGIGDGLVARKNPDTSKNYFLADNEGSITAVTDSSGSAVETTAYYPFGAIRSGGTQSKQLYTGQINDPDTGLDYYNARYYNPHTREFTQPDTDVANVYDPQDLNAYSYVKNNPLTYTDPTGHFALGLCISGILGIGGFVGLQGCFAFATPNPPTAQKTTTKQTTQTAQKPQQPQPKPQPIAQQSQPVQKPAKLSSELGVVGTVSGGAISAATMSIGPGMFFNKSAQKLSDLDGTHRTAGGSVDIPGLGAGVGLDYGADSSLNPLDSDSFAVNASVGKSFPGAETHISKDYTKTKTLWKF